MRVWNEFGLTRYLSSTRCIDSLVFVLLLCHDYEREPGCCAGVASLGIVARCEP